MRWEEVKWRLGAIQGQGTLTTRRHCADLKLPRGSGLRGTRSDGGLNKEQVPGLCSQGEDDGGGPQRMWETFSWTTVSLQRSLPEREDSGFLCETPQLYQPQKA